MDEAGLREFLKSRGYTEERLTAALQAVGEMEAWLAGRNKDVAAATTGDLREYLAELVREGKNTEERLLDLARTMWHLRRNELYIYFASMFGGRNIYASIAARLEEIAGTERKNAVFAGIETPPLGSPTEAYPPVTRLLMQRLDEHLTPAEVRRVLTWNHHGIPAAAFAKHREWFAEKQSIEEFLKKVHAEAVAELEEHAREGIVWYEQEITPEVVAFVRANQEILSAVRDGDRLYMTKIPYAPARYLRETDPRLKRYYACHCPLAREAILDQRVDVPPEWCYCSAGFEKLMLDTVLEAPTEIEVLESALKGDARCRFAMRISPEAR